MLNSTCVIGSTWYAQAGYGIAQTGSLRTSQQDGAAWRTDNALRAGGEGNDRDLVRGVISTLIDPL